MHEVQVRELKKNFILATRIRWAGHVVHIGKIGNACKILLKNLKERHYSEDPGVDGIIMLNWITGK
jgi:hypothetical protein